MPCAGTWFCLRWLIVSQRDTSMDTMLTYTWYVIGVFFMETLNVEEIKPAAVYSLYVMCFVSNVP